MDQTIAFYDQLAADYHFLFADWRESVRRQGATLARLIRAELGEKPLAVLDCSCGIGTQALGLALHGCDVHGTDLSPRAVERARHEAAVMNLPTTFGVADMRRLQEEVAGVFDVVISCDNALPHLLSDEDLMEAAHGMAAKLKPGGLLLVSIRDYDALVQERPRMTEPRVFDDPAGRRIVFQVWDWTDDGHSYDVNHFIVKQDDQGWATSHVVTRYRALLRAELERVLAAAGFDQPCWQMPEQTGYYQPILTARKNSWR